jgi:hypothetical protein
MSTLTSQDFILVYEPGEGQSYHYGRYIIRPQLIGYHYFYHTFFRSRPLGGSETFLDAVGICARHELITNGRGR